MKSECKHNLMSTSVIYYQTIRAVLGKVVGAHNCLLTMTEKQRKIRDEKGIFLSVLTELSKAFVDCNLHNLLIVQLSAYGFDKELLNFTSAYLISRKKTRIGLSISEYQVYCLYSQNKRSILGPRYVESIEFLESTINNIFSSFRHNLLVANSTKSYFF